jgi:hypothetical protein
MKAAELHAHLSNYLAQAPDNCHAEVVLRDAHGEKVYGIAGANDARLMGGGIALIFIPDVSKPAIEIRAVGLQ